MASQADPSAAPRKTLDFVLGPHHSLFAVGLLVPAAVAASRTALRRPDGEMRVRDADIEILRAVPLLGALLAATIEQLGAGLDHAELAPWQVVSSRVIAATGSTWSSPVTRRWSGTDASSTPLIKATDSGEVALLGDLGRTPSARPGRHRCRVAILERPAVLTAVTEYPVSATAGH